VYQTGLILLQKDGDGERLRDENLPFSPKNNRLFAFFQTLSDTGRADTKSASSSEYVTGGPTCTPFIVIVQEHWQRKFAADFRAALRILFMDETHQINQWRWPMTCIGAHDLHGNFIPLVTMICSSSKEEHFETLLRHVKASCHGDLDAVRVFMVDKAEAERNAIHKVFPNCITRLCYWHGIEALRRWVVKAANGVTDPADQQLIKDVYRRLVFADTETDFNAWVTYLENYLAQRDLQHVWAALSGTVVERPSRS